MKVKLLLGHFMVLVVLQFKSVSASCPTNAVNCSFENNEGCLGAYQTYDKHGLKWIQKSGAVISSQVSTHQYNRYSNQYQRNRYQSQRTELQASPKGQYLYIPGTSDSRALGLWTDLISPPLPVVTDGCLHFIFHNNVCGPRYDPDEINFRLSLRHKSDDGRDKLLREYPCINDTAWYPTKIPIREKSGIYRVVFSGKQHSIEEQTIGVDHVIYTDQSCSIKEDANFEDGDCDFEDADMCGYKTHPSHKTTLRWLPVQKEMLEEQHRRINIPEGYFLYLWGIDYQNDTTLPIHVHIRSPKITVKEKGCLSLTYYSGRYSRENGNTTALIITQVNPVNDSKGVLHEIPATLGNEWIKAYVTLPTGSYSIKFSALVVPPFGDHPDDVIALDDIEVHQKSCDDVRCDGIICEAKNTRMCNGRGACVGRGLKHKSCKCQLPYLGQDCEFTPPKT